MYTTTTKGQLNNNQEPETTTLNHQSRCIVTFEKTQETLNWKSINTKSKYKQIYSRNRTNSWTGHNLKKPLRRH